MQIDTRKIFLLDGFGALLSAFLLGIVLVKFESLIGMPSKVLYALSFLACLFAVYSFTCFFKVKENWKLYLKIIAIVNLLYCCLTVVLVTYFYHELTPLGILYFVLEIIVITILATIELKVAKA